MAYVKAPAMTTADTPCNPFFMRILLGDSSMTNHDGILSHKHTAFALQPVEQELNGQGSEQQAHEACNDFFSQGAHPLGSGCAQSQDAVACQTDQANASQQNASIGP